MKTFHGIVSARQKSTQQKSGYQFVCLAFCRWAASGGFGRGGKEGGWGRGTGGTGGATKPQQLRQQLNEFT